MLKHYRLFMCDRLVFFSQSGPSISQGSLPFVHHAILYYCENGLFHPAHADMGSDCDEASFSVLLCRGAPAVAA